MTWNLTSKAALTQGLVALGISNWNDALVHVKNIPYGRNLNREDLSLILKENKGTCSSKHAFLKEIANENNIPNVELIIGIYKMNEFNTKIGTILTQKNVEFIPEAHCYLKINEERVDCTKVESAFEKIKNDLLEEIKIQPFEVGAFKIDYHQNFIKNWLLETNSDITFEKIWAIREQCIAFLS